MPARKIKTAPVSKLFASIGQTLVVIGTPPLFALKILLWTVVWFGNFVLKIAQAILAILRGAAATLAWYGRALIKSASLLTNRIKKVSLPKISLPRISWPKLPTFPHRLYVRPVGRPKKEILSSWLKLRYLAAGFLIFGAVIFTPYWVKSQLNQLPNPRLLTVRDIPVSTKIYDRNGILLYQIYSDENRSIIPLSDLPKSAIDATIAIEDKNFYRHLGFDPLGILRAAFANTRGNGNHQGGSTITQQLIKSALLTPQQTLSRKIKEVILAFWAERIYSKDDILTMYLNQVPYGGAAYGLEAASETYFQKPAKNLTLAESALLAGLPSAPTDYSPYGSHPELAKERQTQVLNAMLAQGYITELQAAAAEKEELKFAPIGTEIKAPHLVMYVKDYLVQKYGIRRVEQGGLEVTTSLDINLYNSVSQVVREGVDRQKYLNVGNGAALVTNPKTGEILAMVGSRDFFDLKNDGNVNVTIAQRSPGSSIKPLNYALAFERGLITPSTVLDDSPVVYKSAGAPPYAPGNYDGKFHGKVTARVALGSSYNIPAVRVLEKNGVKNFIDFAAQLGITTFTDPNRYGLAVTLGGGEIKMTDMAVAYSAFANAGNRVNLTPVLKVSDYRGHVLEDNTGRQGGTRVMSPQTAFLISNILSDDGARAPTFGPGSALNIAGHTVSVKTGTAETKRDNWTIGYTPTALVAVWVGNNNNTPMSPFLESGNTGAAAIWNPIMTTVLKDRASEPITPPDNVIAVSVCTLTGTLTCEKCPSTRTEYFTKGTEPKVACKLTQEDVDKLLHPEKKDEKTP
ncbi:transglycosylase domain-containing protein [Candidatus Microgenomates bacterium]|nr:transglycosylase domain-containing protein [Candidatus Microgenomates bacterium]